MVQSLRLSISALGNRCQRRSGIRAWASMVPLPSGFLPKYRLYLSRASVASSTKALVAFRGWVMRDMSGTVPMCSSRPISKSDDAALYSARRVLLGSGIFKPEG